MYSPEYALFVQHLRTAIQGSTLQQIELADKLGKRQSYISKILAGYQAITVVEAWALLDAAGISFSAWAHELDEALKAQRQQASEEQQASTLE